MKPVTPVTPLRRSDRLRRSTAKAFGSSPGSSPGSAPLLSSSVGFRSRVFFAPGGQTDSDSTLRNTNSSRSSGSSTEDTVGGATDPMGLVSRFPQKLYRAYEGLAPLLHTSDAELMNRVSLFSFSQGDNVLIRSHPHPNRAPHRTFPV